MLMQSRHARQPMVDIIYMRWRTNAKPQTPTLCGCPNQWAFGDSKLKIINDMSIYGVWQPALWSDCLHNALSCGVRTKQNTPSGIRRTEMAVCGWMIRLKMTQQQRETYCVTRSDNNRIPNSNEPKYGNICRFCFVKKWKNNRNQSKTHTKNGNKMYVCQAQVPTSWC